MRVLVLGANGFIGSHVVGALLEAGHGVLAGVRSPDPFLRRFPRAEAFRCDLNRDTDVSVWRSRLTGTDTVINCAGILAGSLHQHSRAIHVNAPTALFTVCSQAGVRSIMHISAVSASAGANTAYAATKLEAEEKLKALELDWIILRPSLVYAAGSYGGTSLLRALAALPFILPIAGPGTQPFRPIHARDLALGMVRLLERNDLSRVTLEPAGPDIITLAELLGKLRAWLGFRPAWKIRVPMGLIRLAARLGDLCGAPTFNTTAVRQLEFGNTGDPDAFVRLSGVAPAAMDQWLLRQPSHVQDRWHARLAWLAPCLRCTLAALWIVSGITGLTASNAASLFATMPVAGGLAVPIVATLSALDLAIGLGLLLRWRPQTLGAIQLIVIVGYTVGLSVATPGLWLAPLGPLLKNIPILAAVGIWMVTENRR